MLPNEITIVPSVEGYDRRKLQGMLLEVSRGLQQSYQDMTAISELSREMISARSTEKIIGLLFDAVDAFLPDSKCIYLEWDALSGDFFCKMDQGITAEAQKALCQHRDVGYYRWATQERRTTVVPERIEDNGRPVSSIVVPLIGSQETLGIIEIFTTREIGEYTQRDLSLISTIANQAAVAMENAQLYDQMALKTEAIGRMKNYLTNILQSIGTGMIVLDTEGKVTIFNKVAEDLFGLSGDDAVGLRLEELFDDTAFAAIDEARRKALDTQSEAEAEFAYERSGYQLPLGVKSAPLHNENGSFLGVMLFISDLTQTKELLNLRQVDKLKDQFVATVSHELRTPLTAIKSFTEILLSYEEHDSETQREFLTIIDAQSEHLTRLIDDILDLSKIESGTAQWFIKQLDLVQLAHQAMAAIDLKTRRKSLQLSLVSGDEVPLIWGDEDKLMQVLANLLDNAIKFTPAGGEITISVRATPAEQAESLADAVTLSIRDSGPGIPAHHVERVFDKFHQVGDVLKDKPQGTGLGLSICREIVQYLKGQIWAESQPGNGATFHVLLPACNGHPFEIRKGPSTHAEAPRAGSGIGGVESDAKEKEGTSRGD